ncbi:hypothetical protein [Paenibacillus sp.]|uniref:hypothetical protein n=1 Tax=Paenibacillus sp. TaxID=58172 RepID=UPI002D421A80|nr:hypothetical protein [Paenibacillus sp.]HZG83488.1 hypothetical protein [Paenibacillus sp.]
MEKEYTHRLREEKGFTSPASGLPSFELKMLQQHIHGTNLQRLGERLPHRKKELMLVKFLKHRRNQPVELFYRAGGRTQGVIGKAAGVGRDFAMLTTLFERLWIPYAAVESAQTPFGLPEVSGSHHHIAMDDRLRGQLLQRFGETVANQETLRRQFFEESLWRHLQRWRGARVKVLTDDAAIIGTLANVTAGELVVRVRTRPFRAAADVAVPLKDVRCIRTARALATLLAGLRRGR